ncbi:MAG: chalcone isomerase family protein [Candidatus Hydrogenedentota bacterium]|nr:MAG: chalcone isomerase family protein [Candidatus Hydrogenedentota bacterium]
MNLRNTALLLLAVIIWAMKSTDVLSVEIAGVSFADTYNIGNTRLTITGVGLLRYMVFIKAYVAAFYLEDGADVENALSVMPKRLEIQYFHPIKAKDFAFSTDKLIAENVEPELIARLRPRIDRINELYEDVEPGDRYSLTYIPGKGTEIALNGQPKGIIEGADFASAIFSIWLGPKPLSRSLKAALLGKQ